MDPFEVRMHFLSMLRRLNASQQTIQKVVSYALKYLSRCGEDIWDCVMEECQKGTVNTRINILYFLDSLCEESLVIKANASGPGTSYVDYVSRDLAVIIQCVVPEGREGLINLMSAEQVLHDWRTKRVIDPQKLDEILAGLESRKATSPIQVDEDEANDGVNENEGNEGDDASTQQRNDFSSALSRNEIFKRIEQDRERHKRLRERRWVQPIAHNPHPHVLPQLATFMPPTDDMDGSAELTIDIEFDNEWETTSDWNEDDDEAVTEENKLCYPNAATRFVRSQADLSIKR